MGSRELGFAVMPPTSLHRWLPLAGAALLVLAFGAIAPFAHTQLLRFNSFVPTVAAINFVTNLATAGLLFAIFSTTASRSILVLGSGYFFAALIVIPWALTFPGAFAPTGLLGAGLQSTPWLFTFWNLGFAASVIGYGCLKNGKHTANSARTSTQSAIYCCLAAVIGLVCAMTWVVTVCEEFMPPLFSDEIGLAPMAHIDTGIILSMCAFALLLLWTRRTSILDLWLMVAVCALALELIVVTWMITTRFSLGFYFSGVLSSITSITLLVLLLSEGSRLYSWTLQRKREKGRIDSRALLLDFVQQVRQPLTGIAAHAGAARRFLEQTPPDIDRVKCILDDVIRACFRADEVLQEFRDADWIGDCPDGQPPTTDRPRS